jgi:hypothetical protein
VLLSGAVAADTASTEYPSDPQYDGTYLCSNDTEGRDWDSGNGTEGMDWGRVNGTRQGLGQGGGGGSERGGVSKIRMVR